MAEANICDKCGVFYKKKAIKIDGVKVHDLRITNGSNEILPCYEGKAYDLCPKCLESLKQWLKGEGNVRNNP